MEYETIVEGIVKKLPTLHPLVLLKKAISSDQLRSHAFLISGGLWEGQTYWAQYFALEAARIDDPHLTSLQQNFDMHFMQDTGEQISVDEAKKLRTKLTQSARGRRHIVIIENIERLNSHNTNNEAANALLKVLEEPPVETLFLLTTSSQYEVLPTIISRVQVVSVRITEDVYKDLLKSDYVLGSKIELSLALQDEKFKESWAASEKIVDDLFDDRKTLTERILMLGFLYPPAKDAQKETGVFTEKNIFFFQMEMAIEQRSKLGTIDEAAFEHLQKIHKNLIQLKKDFSSYINKKLAVEHFIISSFLPSVYE